jgi:hypothetical protein
MTSTREPPEGAVTHALGWHLPGWRDFEIRLVIDFAPFEIVLRPRSKKPQIATIRPVFSWKRSRQVVMIKGRGSIGLTPQAKNWAKAAATQLRGQWSAVFREPLPKRVRLNAAIVSYLRDARLIDASNLYQGPEDVMQACRPKCKRGCMVHAGVMDDDSQIESHDRSRRLIDRENSRVEITLTPYDPGKARRNPEQTEIAF